MRGPAASGDKQRRADRRAGRQAGRQAGKAGRAVGARGEGIAGQAFLRTVREMRAEGALRCEESKIILNLLPICAVARAVLERTNEGRRYPPPLPLRAAETLAIAATALSITLRAWPR